jgi:cyanophycinase
MIPILFVLLCISTGIAGAAVPRFPPQIITKDYVVWCTGTCNGTDLFVKDTIPGVALQGGVDVVEAFEWQIRNARGGDMVVLEATTGIEPGYRGEYQEYLFDMAMSIGAPLHSVRTVLFKDRNASFDETVLSIIAHAESIFFEGGDQSRYINYWKDSPVEAALQSKLSSITIGGTSAGLAILGNYIYSALNESAESSTVLADPYHPSVTMAPALLRIPFLETVLTDTHFKARDRMGRMCVFAARLMQGDCLDADHPAPDVLHSVGVDEGSALLLDTTTGAVRPVGDNSSYICTTTRPAEVCAPASALTYHGVECVRVGAGDSYSFASWTGDGVRYTNDITGGSFEGNPYGGSGA